MGCVSYSGDKEVTVHLGTRELKSHFGRAFVRHSLRESLRSTSCFGTNLNVQQKGQARS